MCIELSHPNNEEMNEPSSEEMELDDSIVDLDDYDETSSGGDNWNLEVLAGGSLIEHPPLFSPDGRSLFVICNNIVRSFVLSTGEWEFDLQSSDGRLIGMQFSISKPHLLIACSAQGTVYQFRWKSGVLDRKVQLIKESTVMGFSLIRHKDACLINYCVGNKGKIDLYDYDKGTFIYQFPAMLKKTPVLFAVPVEHHKFFAVVQKKRIHIIGDHLKPMQRVIKNFQKNDITSIVCHPTEECIATGDVTGRVILWRNFIDGKPKEEIYHWHSSPVAALAFSSTGTFFYSGAAEAVLVKWTINDPDTKKFLPRMAAAIAQIAVGVENSIVVVATRDNAIYIHDAQLKLQRTVQYFTYMTEDGSGQEPFPIGLKVDPRTQAIVMNGRIGHLQFYSAMSQSLMYNLDITLQNVQTKEPAKVLYNTRVTHVALNKEWMATAECWDDFDHVPEVRIKFWFFIESKQSYSLNTNVESPHDQPITALEFSNPPETSSLLCASAGHDRTVRLWALEDSPSIYRKSKVWMCTATFTYKNLPVISLSFSRDASILATGFAYVLCCWDTRTLQLKCALNPPSGIDGNIGKIVLTMPSKESNADRRQKHLKAVKTFLETDGNKLVKNVTPAGDTTKLDSLNLEGKKAAFRLLKETNYLDVYQKVQAIVKLEIPVKISEQGRTQLIKLMEVRQATMEEKRLSMPSRVHKLKRRDKFNQFLKYNKYQKYKPDDWFETFVTGVESSTTETAQKTHEVTTEKMTAPTQIKHVIFGSADHSHIMLVVNDEKVMAWNLLTTRLIFSSFLTIEHIAFDEQTNLVAAFTANKELHVFNISHPMRYYVRPDMPAIHGAVWIPRRYPLKSSLLVNWQAQSELYFFSHDQQLAKLSTKKFTAFAPALPQIRPSNKEEYSTPFAKILTGQTLNETARPKVEYGDRINEPGKAMINEFISMSAHAAPPLRLMCTNFTMSLLKKRRAQSAETTTENDVLASNGTTTNGEDDSESDAEDSQSKENRMKILDGMDKQIDFEREADPQVEKELAKLYKKLDFSSFSLDSD